MAQTTLEHQGAESVAAFLARTADESAAGISWESLSYQNELIRRHDLWDGVPGIALFLADYAAIAGAQAARELATRALAWSEAQARISPHPDPDGRPSLGRGAAGLALAYFHLAAAGDSSALERAAHFADEVARSDVGRNPSLLWGTAGEALLLIRAWRATNGKNYRDAAVRRGVLLRDGALVGALAAMGERPIPIGLAPGLAGVGVALAHLLDATGDEQWVAPVRQISECLLDRARPDEATAGGFSWPAHSGADAPTGYQWCIGIPGIGLFFGAAARALNDAALLDTAISAGEATYAHGDVRQNPSLCHGLAGGAELLIDLFRRTGEERWLTRAQEFAERASGYRTSTPQGDVWPADEPGLVAPNLSTGAAGVGRLFLQVRAPEKVGSLFQ